MLNICLFFEKVKKKKETEKERLGNFINKNIEIILKFHLL